MIHQNRITYKVYTLIKMKRSQRIRAKQLLERSKNPDKYKDVKYALISNAWTDDTGVKIGTAKCPCCEHKAEMIIDPKWWSGIVCTSCKREIRHPDHFCHLFEECYCTDCDDPECQDCYGDN